MARIKQKVGREYTRKYSDIRGVELGGSGAEISKSRLAYSENLYRDYEGDDSAVIESIPGYRRIASLGGRVHSIILQRVGEGEEYLLIHSGEGLYRMKISERNSGAAPPKIAALPDRKCAHFTHGGRVYILTGDGILSVSPDGTVGDGAAGDAPYLPVIEVNGESHEDKNLLSDKARARYIISGAGEYDYGTPGIKYTVLDRSLRTCAASGIDYAFSGALYIPGYTKIGGETYRVVEILPHAFSHLLGLTELYIGEGVEKVGTSAFRYCISLSRASLAPSVYEISGSAFEGCTGMTDIYLDTGLAIIGYGAFVERSQSLVIHYAGSQHQFNKIEGTSDISAVEKRFNDGYSSHELLLPAPRGTVSVIGVTEDGNAVGFTSVTDGKYTAAVRLTSSADISRAHEYIMTVKYESTPYSFAAGKETDGKAAILGCTVAESFDNRIFLAGNPKLPNTVFYSSASREDGKAALYFGSLSYFNDGTGGYPVSALLSTGGLLAVLKSGDDGSGSIFYHTPTDTGDEMMPRVYAVSYAHSGIGAVGEAISFMDDPVFLSRGGLFALDKKDISLERSVVCRSHNVNFGLEKEDLSSASMTVWQGYLVILTGERAYLADSRATFRHRSGGAEYEWFTLSGLGSFEGDREVWRYNSFEDDFLSAHEDEGEVYPGELYSYFRGKDEIFYGVVEGKKYSLYKTGERSGGAFYPATVALGVGELLFFGTEGGALMLFNNDKRGVAPDSLRLIPGFDPEEYRARAGSGLHPEFYSREGHAVRYALKTASDSCDAPHLPKSTVKHSLAIRARCVSPAVLRVEVGTGGDGVRELTAFPGGRLSFGECDLSSLSLTAEEYQTVPIAERERDWIEKQLTVYTDGYASPIAISMIAYRYTVGGRIRMP